MTVGGIIVISWPIKIRRHKTNRIKIVLLLERLAQLDASDLGNGIPLICRLKRTS